MNQKSSLQNLVGRVADRLALRNDSSALSLEQRPRPLLIEALEPRVLFSGSPAPAPEAAPAEAPAAQESQAPAEATPAADAPANEAAVAAPPEASGGTEAAAPADQTETAIVLTDTEVAVLSEAATQIWAASGISSEQSVALANATYQIADLGGNILGSAEGNVITIDDDAAGRGWFVDSTPEDDSEFTLGASGSATTSIDLLSVLLHEQGHLLGLDDSGASGGDVMFEVFDEGERRLPTAGRADGAVAGSLEGVHLAVAEDALTNGFFDSNAAAFTNSPGYTGGGNPSAIDGWTYSGSGRTGINGSTIITPGLSSPFGPSNQLGTLYYAFLQNPGSLTQDITLQATTDYEFGFHAANRGSNPAAAGRVTIADNSTTYYDSGINNWSTSTFQAEFAQFTTGASFDGPVTITLSNDSPAGDNSVNYANLFLNEVGVITYDPITGDADSGISSSKVYTHAIDFGNQPGSHPTATVNGVVFANGGVGSFPSPAGSSQTVGTGSTTLPNTHNGNGVADPFLVDGGVEDLVGDMIFNDPTGEITLTGLTVGADYQFKLYNRPWGIGNDRQQTVRFDIDNDGNADQTRTFNADDASDPNPGFGTASQVYALTYNYTAESDTLTVNIDNHRGATYHLYGLTNEEVPTTLNPGDPLIPAGLGAGDTFQLVFVSESKIQRDLLDGNDDGSDDSTVADWNGWVNLQADGSSLSGISDLDWSAIVSLPGTDARDNAVVSAPVYLTDGTLVATDFADMWDGSIANAILINENGAAINTAGGSGSGRLVWTGSDSDGTVNVTYPLGNGTGDGRTGNSPSSTGSWIAQGTHERRNPNTSLRVYALSEVITIAGGGETIPPTLASSDIVDNKGGGPVDVGETVNFTVTFSEDIIDTTVSAEDFSNAGTAGILIGAIAETSASSGVFTVEVTPTSAGTLQLQVPAGASIQDAAGNLMDTAAATPDDTTIAVEGATLSFDDPRVPAGLGAGDTFQVVFVSESKIQRDLLDGNDDGSDDSTVGDWDGWVNSQASSSTLPGVSDLYWSAIVSTTSVAAKDHAVVSGPVYLTDGTLVANDFSDMWDGSIANAILINENGAAINTAGGSGSGRLVWTGSDSDGTVNATYPLGNGTGDGRTGNSPDTGGSWIAQGTHERRNPDTPLRVYALSETITITGPTLDAVDDNFVNLVSNGDFEADSYTVAPGYTSVNGGTITDWAHTGGVGINPGGSSPFRNNGDNSTQVAFVQGPGSLSQTITGLTTGAQYELTFDYNERANGGSTTVTATIAGETFTDTNNAPVEGANSFTVPYREANLTFTATAASELLTLSSVSNSGDQSSLFDNVVIRLLVNEDESVTIAAPGILGNDLPAPESFSAGTGGSLAGANSVDTANGTRLNVDEVNTVTLDAGTYAIPSISFKANAGGGGGFVRPFLAKAIGTSGNEYETLWVGDQINVTSTGEQTVSYTGESIVLDSTTEIFTGIYHTGGALVFFANGGSTDHDGTPSEPSAEGQAVTGFSNPNLSRTYAFGVDLIGVPTIVSYDATSAKGAAVTVNGDGSFTYDPTAAGDLQALAAGESTTDTFTYRITDGDPQQIGGLFNTGAGLAPGANDPNWVITSSPGGFTGPAVVQTNHPAWLANDASSNWLGVTSAGTNNVPAGEYTYETTFDLTGFDETSAELSLGIAVDDSAVVFLNGVNVGSAAGFGGLSPVTVSSDFVKGINTLTVVATNGGNNPGGFRAEISGTAPLADTATVSIQVDGVNDAPVILPDLGAGISYQKITGDADSGIDSGKTYTHTLDFGQGTPGALINGVQFDAYNNAADGTLNFSRAVSSGSESDHAGNGSHNVTGDLANLMTDMYYNNGNAAGGTTTWTLSGLTAGETYETRIYTRSYGTTAGTRTATIVFDPDGAGSISDSTGPIKEDDATTVGLDADDAYFLTYRFTAVAGEDLVITATQAGAGQSWHLYGLTNEVVDVSTLTGNITETADVPGGVDPDPTAATGTINFTDVDLTDTHTAAILDSNVTGGTATLSAQQEATLLSNFALGALSESGGAGSVGWTYGVTNAEIDFLADGETVELTATVAVSDDTIVNHASNLSGSLASQTDAAGNILATLTNNDIGLNREVVIEFVTSRTDTNAGDSWFALGLNPAGFLGLTSADSGTLVRTINSPDTSAHSLFNDGANVANIASTADSTTTRVKATISLSANGIANGETASILVEYDDGNDGSINSTLSDVFTIDANALDIGVGAQNQAHDYSEFSVTSFSASEDVVVTITGANDAPVAVDDTADVLEDGPSVAIDVLANDSDVDGAAVTLANPDLEADTYTVNPGYTSGNGGIITGWTHTGGVGINPWSGGSPFRDNGANATQVAFIQGTGSLSQVVSGLTVGAMYEVTFDYNERLNDSGPSTTVMADIAGANFTDSSNTPVGGSNPYRTATLRFVAGNTSETLTISGASNGGDATTLIDNVQIQSVLEATTTITGVNGATGLVTINDNGTPSIGTDDFLEYDPNGQFENLPDGVTVTDTFTYTINDGMGAAQTGLSITDLFNTGVGAGGAALGNDVDDPHYEITTDPSGFGDATVPDGTFPIPPWFANDGDSRWIGPDAATASGPGGDYTYSTTFTLPANVDLSNVSISGDWATDNQGLDILINGISTGQTNSAQFGSLTAFTINSGFQAGMNTLEFVVNNAGGGPTGLRVDNMAGTYDTVAGGVDTATVVVTINGLNDAPTFEAGTEDFNDVAVNDFSNDGDTVGYLLDGSTGDVDDSAPARGIAIVGESLSRFEYLDTGDTTWKQVDATAGSALLLLETDRVRYVPDGSSFGTETLTYRAWDQFTGLQYGRADLSVPGTSTGGTSAFSAATASSDVTVANVVIDTPGAPGSGTLTYGAADGEVNHITVGMVGGNLVITDQNGNPLSGQGATGSTVTVDPSDFEDIVIDTGDADDTITVGDMTGFTGSLTVLGGAGFDEVLLANGATLALGTGVSDGGADENLLVDGETFKADLDSSVSVVGDGTIDITAAGGVGDFAGLNLRRASLSSEGGGITLSGVGGDTGNTNDGVVLTHGSTVSTGGGGVTITGTATSTTGANDGISLLSGSDITAGGAGGITLTGTSSGVNSSYGVQLFSGTEVTTAGGDIAIVGSSDAVGSRNAGIYTNGATVTAGGAGSVAMTGTGGGAGSNNNGLSLAATAVDAGTSGDVTLVGMGGGGTSGNGGVQVGTRTSVSADGGDVTITGTGGAGTGVRNTGVSLLSGSSVSSGGDTEITGVAGTGTSRNGGVSLVSSTVSAAGDLTVDGTGNGTGSYNSGISSSRSTLGGADVTLAGTGSTSSTAGRFNDGVSISRGGVTASGTLTIDAAGGTGSRDNRGLMVNRAVLGGTLAVTGSADTGSGSRSTGVFIQNSVLSDDGTIEGTGGGVGGADGFGVYMRNITGGANLGVTTAPDTEEEKGGNYFDAVLPAVLVLGAGAGAGAGNRRKREVLAGLISRLPKADTAGGDVEVYHEDGGHVGLTPLVVSEEALTEAGIAVPEIVTAGARQILLLMGGESGSLSGLFAMVDTDGMLESSSPLHPVEGVTDGGLMEMLERAARPSWAGREAGNRSAALDRAFSEAFGL